jgi:protein phosphatase
MTQCGPVHGDNFEYHWTGAFLEAHLLSDLGKKRTRNEDSCLLCAPEDADLANQWGLLFAVADGMGGASAGEFASRFALEAIAYTYFAGASGNIPTRLREALEDANQRIFVESETNLERHGMGTTVSAVIVNGDCAYIAQVGDSRVYVARKKGSILQVTEDHSLVAEQVRNGYISAQEARSHSLKNLITRAIGIRDTVKVDLFAFRLKEGDTLLICSDGLCNLVDDPEIADVLAMENLQASARVLVGRAIDEGGSDNITALLLRVAHPPPHQEFHPGAIEVDVPQAGLFRKFMRVLTKPR